MFDSLHVTFLVNDRVAVVQTNEYAERRGPCAHLQVKQKVLDPALLVIHR